MSITTTETRLVATVYQGNYGLWFVRVSGNGYPTEEVATPERLLALRRDGYALGGDVELFVDFYGPPELQEPYMTASEMDADSAGYGYSYIGARCADYGHGSTYEEE